jgi:hypothetical protein
MRGITSASALRYTGEVGKTVGEKSLFFRAWQRANWPHHQQGLAVVDS